MSFMENNKLIQEVLWQALAWSTADSVWLLQTILPSKEEHIIQSLLKNISEPNKSHSRITFHAFTSSIQEERTFQDKVTFSQQKGILVESFTIWLKCPQEEFLKFHLF